MSIAYRDKLKKLHRAWPRNAVITTSALKAKGFSDQLIQKYSHSGWLKRIGVGAFIRQNDQVSWQGSLYAIQHDLKKSIHIGGLTALERSGLGHYLGLSSEKMVYLYNTASTRQSLPGWFIKYINQEGNINYKQCHIFDEEIGLETQLFEGLEIVISQPERAILEVLYLVPEHISVEHASKLVENLQNIRPEITQQLLESCRHILIKRLFLCLADLCQLPILKHLNTDKIDLGSGDRTVMPGGKYFPKYKHVLPYDDNDDLEEDVSV